MYKKIKFSASAMCFDWLNVKNQLKEIEELDVDYLHMDIIDGNFIPDFTMGSSIINSIRSGTNMQFYYTGPGVALLCQVDYHDMRVWMKT